MGDVWGAQSPDRFAAALRAMTGEDLRRVAASLDAEQICDEVTKSGLRGRGGAGFPVGVKWRTVLDAADSLKFVTCNADEGDSGTFADRMLMEGDPFLLIEGMVIAGIAVGAEIFGGIEAERAHLAHRANEPAIIASAMSLGTVLY